MGVKRETVIKAYTIIMAIFVFGIFAAPIIAMSNPAFAGYFYMLYAPTCHQYPYRSFCLTADVPWVKSCIEVNETGTGYSYFSGVEKIKDLVYSSALIGYERSYIIEVNGKTGYKLPVCERDIGFYLAMLGSAFAYWRTKKNDEPLHLWVFIALMLPLAVDGTLQLVMPYESGAMIRMITGIIAGVGVTYMLLPMVIKFLNP